MNDAEAINIKEHFHRCCGCSCHVCENGHGSGNQPHSKECLERFEQVIYQLILKENWTPLKKALNDTNKINAKLDDLESGLKLNPDYSTDNYTCPRSLIDALRIAVEGLERCQKRTLHAKNTIWEIAKKLEVKT